MMTKKKINKEEVLHISELCNLPLTEEEIKRLEEMLGDALDYIDVLNELNTEKIPETYQVTGLTNVFQKDGEKVTTLSQKEALSNASEVIDEMFATKAIFNRE